jgi:ribosomal protein S6E (S10)
VQRSITDNLSLGGELVHQTATTVGGKDQTGFDLGLTYDLSEHYHLLLSAGPGIQNRSTTNAFFYYAALQCTF